MPEEISVSQKDLELRSKRSITIDALWKTFCSLGSLGDMWTPNMQEPEYIAQAKLIVTDGWAELSGIEQHLKTLTERHLQSRKSLIGGRLIPLSVRIFLGTFRSKGPTVPKRKLDSLRWLQDNFGPTLRSRTGQS